MSNASNALTRLLTFAAILLTVLTLASFFGEFSSRLQLLSQLRAQLALGLLLVVVPLLWLKPRRGLLFALPLIVNVAPVIALYVPNSAEPSDGQTLTISHVNIDRDKIDMLDRLNAHGSDIVFIQEVQPPIAEAFAERMPDYAVKQVAARWDTRGSAMLVRKAWEGQLQFSHQIEISGYGDRPIIVCTIGLNRVNIAVMSLHVSRPTNALQVDEFADVARWSRNHQERGREVLVIGDFNQTPWSNRFQDLLEDGNLLNGQRGHGLQTTWPASLPPFLRIPIDHTVHSDGIVLVKREVGDDWGGDHRPIHVKLATVAP